MSNIDSDLIRGNIDTIILKTLLDGDKYGLDIIKEVETRSNGTYELKQPTLYSCLKRLENQELISSYWLDSDIGGRRHYYKLSEKGRETLQKKQEEWMKSKFIIDNLLSNFNSDEYRLVKKDDYDRIIEGKQFAYENNLSTSAVSETTDEINEPEIVETEADDETALSVSDDETLENEGVMSDEVVEETIDFDASESEDDEDDRPVVDYSTSEGNLHRLVSQYANIEIPAEYLSESPADEPAEENDITPNKTITISLTEEVDEDDEDELYDEETEESNEYETMFDYDENTEFEDIDDENYESSIDENEEETYADSHIYYSHSYEQVTDEEDAPAVVPDKDQTVQELNALNFLRRQDDEEINTYVGDKNSYINHLNVSDTHEVVQQNIMDLGLDDDISSVDKKINEFEQATKELYNFNSSPYSDEVEDEHSQIENYGLEIDKIDKLDNLIEIAEDDYDCNCGSNSVEEIITYDEPDDDFLAELSELGRKSTSGFYNSTDRADYNDCGCSSAPVSTASAYTDYTEYDSSDASFENEETFSTSYESNFEDDSSFTSFDLNESDDDVQEIEENVYEEENHESESSYNYSDFDSIISRSANSYTEENTKYLDNNTFETFTPRYTSENYKQKLSNLSAYSKVGSSEIKTEPEESQDLVETTSTKFKDIKTLKAEFEEEGIKMKEYRRHGVSELAEKNYLLVNKINLIRSLILLFGYVFILSAVYIIMSNTSMKSMEGFSFVWFVYGFIPFIAYAGYHTVMYFINPYKKTPAKYAPRIMLFISFIITIQLLLITYCVNLQLGFYSFSQNFYNHLLWIIPTIVSFAPMVSNIIYITLFYSKNFNV